MRTITPFAAALLAAVALTTGAAPAAAQQTNCFRFSVFRFL